MNGSFFYKFTLFLRSLKLKNILRTCLVLHTLLRTIFLQNKREENRKRSEKMDVRKFGFIRVSSKDQNEGRQLEAIKKIRR
jgi:hypothetical protein